ncbi:MAG: TOBE domain-containing protein, partial [Alphaproteobacteria bacterium]|nr:TOBE domain-containing protein [Alphaproteobacteria bacterium]
ALSARIERTAFQGAVTNLVARPDAAPEVELHLATAGPPPQPGSPVAIAVADGWVLPR